MGHPDSLKKNILFCESLGDHKNRKLIRVLSLTHFFLDSLCTSLRGSGTKIFYVTKLEVDEIG